MQNRAAIFSFFLASLLPVLAFAQQSTTTSAGATVTYAPSTEYTCPANATLNGNLCYCQKGFKVSGTQCVKDEPPPPPPAPAGNEIYIDIRTAVAFNETLTCSQLGFVVPADLEMCTKFKASTDKASWKSIQRPPISTGPIITNPWAPPSQQIIEGLASSTPQSVPAIPIIKPNPPPAPPEPTPPPVPEPEPEPAAKAMPAMKTAEELEPEKTTAPEAVVPTTTVETASLKPQLPPLPEESMAQDTGASQFASIGSIQEGVAAVSPITPGLSPISMSDIMPAAEAKAAESLPKQSFFSRIASWFFGLF
jgi:hypothetical protein